MRTAITLSAMGSSISDITDLMISLTESSDMLNYVDHEEAYKENYLEVVNGANESMRVLLRANNMVDYAALVSFDESLCRGTADSGSGGSAL